MTRGVAGFLLALACLLPLGTGVLLLCGLWDRFRGALRIGIAIFAGLAAAAAFLPWLVYAGLSPSLPVILVAGVLALAAGLARGRLGRVESVRLEPLAALVLAAPLLLLAVAAVDQPIHRYDAFASWVLKAKILAAGGTFTGALDENALADPSVAPPTVRQYPLGLPALDAYVLRGIGAENTRILNLLAVALLAGLAFVVWGCLRRRVGPWPLAAGLSLLLWMPQARGQALSAYADVPLACFFVAATLLLGVWLAERDGGALALSSICAAAALATKRDAIAFCVVLYAVAVVALVVRRQGRRLVPLTVAVLAVVATTVPWRLFVAAHDLETRDIKPSVSQTLDRADELPDVLRHFGELSLRAGYLAAVPLAAAAAGLLLLRRGERQLALGVLALLAGLTLALAVVYVNGVAGVSYLLRTSSSRTVMTVTLFAAVVLPLLLTRLLRAGPEEPGRVSAPRGSRRAIAPAGTSLRPVVSRRRG